MELKEVWPFRYYINITCSLFLKIEGSPTRADRNCVSWNKHKMLFVINNDFDPALEIMISVFIIDEKIWLYHGMKWYNACKYHHIFTPRPRKIKNEWHHKIRQLYHDVTTAYLNIPLNVYEKKSNHFVNIL